MFDRDHRGTDLTAAGRRLLTDAYPLLKLAEAALRRVGTRTFTVAFMPGLVVSPLTRVLAARHPELTIEVLRTDWADQVEVLLDGRADVGLIRLPVPTDGLRIRPVLDEPREVALPADHPLAGKESVELGDLAGERLLQDASAVPEWLFASRGEGYRSVEEKLEHVAAGEGVVILPASTAGFYTRPDVITVPVADLGPTRVAVAWSALRDDPLVDEFAGLAAMQPDQGEEG